ncbi:MAG TPA: acyl-CoA thioesterase [Synergistaceae bacterium]|nr:acyl-CoA thioesterase [Synergistaceae bacterium]
MSIEISYTTRVRYGDTDQMGVAYYANYLAWFEVGRTEFCRSLGKSYAFWEGEGVFLPVVEAHCRYKHPARYDEEITLHTRVGELRPTTITFECRVTRTSDGKLLAAGWTRHVFADREGRLIRGDNPMRRWIEAQKNDGGVADGD